MPLEFTDPLMLFAAAVLPVLWLTARHGLSDQSAHRRRRSLAVRSTGILLLILSLAGLSWLRPAQQRTVVFAVDRSLSMGDPRGEQTAELTRRLMSEFPDCRHLVLPFSNRPGSVTEAEEFLAATASELSQARPDSAPAGPGTDIESALRLSAAGISADSAGLIVLLSDGQQSQGDMLAAAEELKIPINTVPLSFRPDREIMVSEVRVPERVPAGEPFTVTVAVDASAAGDVRLEVFAGDFRIADDIRTVSPGTNQFEFTQKTDKPAVYTARVSAPVRVAADQSVTVDADFPDTIPENNSASGIVLTDRQPAVLLIEAEPRGDRSLEWALDEQQIRVESRPPAGLPDRTDQLQDFDVVIFSDVAAEEFSQQQLTTLNSWVRELGGGFIMLGSDRSFGLGGYHDSPIDPLLPVRSDRRREKPGLAMVLVIDKSGSMGGQKMAMAREAARGAVELLGPKDQIGVIAFDGTTYWISEITSAARSGSVTAAIDRIDAGGGTSLYPALEQALLALQSTTSRLKHVVVLTDGYSTPADFDSLVTDIAQSRITVSTVGVGDADRATLEQIAERGGGRTYYAETPESVPQIFAQETLRAGKSALHEEPFLPQVVRTTSLLTGVDIAEAPLLLGCVVTQARPTSEVVLATEDGEPLLAWWRSGLGICASFTSDARALWAAEWTVWPQFGQFWAQVIRHCRRRPDQSGAEWSVRLSSGLMKIRVRAMNPDETWINDADFRLQLMAPDRTVLQPDLVLLGPGTYGCDIPADQQGAWTLLLRRMQGDSVKSEMTRSVMVGFHDELRIRPPNSELLTEVSRISGGTSGSSAGEFRGNPSNPVQRTGVPLRPWLLTIGALLFVIDVALRRLPERSRDQP